MAYPECERLAKRKKRMSEKRCWCGKPAIYLIRNKLPTAELITYACEEHRDDTFSAIKWMLVAGGTWIPGALTWENLQK